jgi:aryl-alcohol dehydrogenase-like predicted oxidoreductase
MDYCTLGRTGIEVSRLSFGASSLGSVFRPIDEEEGIRAVRAALDAGINYFDVAPAYGGTVAESILGKALRGIARDRYHLSTKSGKYFSPQAVGGETLDFSRTRIRSELERSMERLGVDFIDIVHLHDFEYQGRSRTESAFAEGFSTLIELKNEGRIGAVGAGTYPMDLWHRVVGDVPVDAIMLHNHYCLNDTRGLELVPRCNEKNIGLINASPYASGLLTGAPVPDWHPAAPEDLKVFAEAASYCRERRSSLPKLAFQFASQGTPFHTTMFSTARTDSLLRNLEWSREPIDRVLLGEVRRILETVKDKQWDFGAGADPLRSAGPRSAQT